MGGSWTRLPVMAAGSTRIQCTFGAPAHDSISTLWASLAVDWRAVPRTSTLQPIFWNGSIHGVVPSQQTVVFLDKAWVAG